MRRHRVVTALLMSVAFVVATAVPAHAATVRQFSQMNGANEFPGPGDPDGQGVTIVDMKVGNGKICVQLAFNNIAAPTLFHIHQAAAGASGPIVVDFTSLIPTRGGCVTSTPTLLMQIRDNPAGFYCNVHNGSFPNGAIRGQLQTSG